MIKTYGLVVVLLAFQPPDLLGDAHIDTDVPQNHNDLVDASKNIRDA